MTSQGHSNAEQLPFTAECPHVVVADDDPLQVEYLAALLQGMGFRCTKCTNSDSVVELIRNTDATLLICDIEMPGLNGLEITRLIRSSSIERYIYIIIVTARNIEGDYEAGLEAGADDFMLKPITPTLFSIRVNVARRILNYQSELVQKTNSLIKANQHLQQDLLAAGKAQQAILPQERLSSRFYSIAHIFEPSHYVSGDTYNFFLLENDCIGFYAVDVAGHGVKAALLAATVAHIVDKEFFDSMTFDASRTEYSPAKLADELNRRFCTYNSIDNIAYFTMFCGILNPTKQKLTYCQAGHPRPLYITKNEKSAWLGEGGFPIGLFERCEYTNQICDFFPGDRLIVHSDGITEAMDSKLSPYGEQRFLELMLRLPENDPENLSSMLINEIRAWTGISELHDDISMIMFNYRK
ncbi:PP2C family protein-serine/threonine phosphatase [Azotobacter beijerinckii]|uniref:PP2C family protein-serine/threonine phosphatase n=1 Tax=Azotobacter beijerinckii TaxID=170623 RepID=UPI00295408C2|nr:SpoIIE family protein phosphatase [Azotobacter beijerinckii]MDV7213398.1 SpoIIE family protein phosphatase [Azotobacter beijerinckii]